MGATGRLELVPFDLDGTLIRGDNCVQTIGRGMGRPEWGEQFEVLRMREQSAEVVRRRVQPWLQRDLEELTRHLSAARLAPGAVEAFETLRRHAVATAIVSIGWSFAVQWFARTFGADYYVGTQLRSDGVVTHLWPEDKGRWLTSLAADLGVDRAPWRGSTRCSTCVMTKGWRWTAPHVAGFFRPWRDLPLALPHRRRATPGLGPAGGAPGGPARHGPGAARSVTGVPDRRR